MDILSNYSQCFDGDFRPYYTDLGELKIICLVCGNEAQQETTTTEKFFTCTCGSDARYSCSVDFYVEMVADALAKVTPDTPEVPLI